MSELVHAHSFSRTKTRPTVCIFRQFLWNSEKEIWEQIAGPKAKDHKHTLEGNKKC